MCRLYTNGVVRCIACLVWDNNGNVNSLSKTEMGFFISLFNMYTFAKFIHHHIHIHILHPLLPKLLKGGSSNIHIWFCSTQKGGKIGIGIGCHGFTTTSTSTMMATSGSTMTTNSSTMATNTMTATMGTMTRHYNNYIFITQIDVLQVKKMFQVRKNVSIWKKRII